MHTPKYGIRAGLAAVLVVLVAIGFAPAQTVIAQGNFSAQIQLALRNFLAGDQTITGDWTCAGTCTGFGGGGGTISGTIATGQIAVGTDTNEIGGSSALTFDGTLLDSSNSPSFKIGLGTVPWIDFREDQLVLGVPDLESEVLPNAFIFIRGPAQGGELTFGGGDALSESIGGDGSGGGGGVTVVAGAGFGPGSAPDTPNTSGAGVTLFPGAVSGNGGDAFIGSGEPGVGTNGNAGDIRLFAPSANGGTGTPGDISLELHGGSLFAAGGLTYNFNNLPQNIAPADSFDTPGNWDVTPGWTLAGAGTGAVHTPGSTDPLTNTSMDPITALAVYWVKVTHGAATAGSVTVYLGGQEVMTLGPSTSTAGFMIRTSTTDPLAFVPTTDYDGTLVSVVVTLATPIATFTPDATTSLLFPDPMIVNQLGGLQIGNPSAFSSEGYASTSSQILVGGTSVGDIWPEIGIFGLGNQGAFFTLASGDGKAQVVKWPTAYNDGAWEFTNDNSTPMRFLLSTEYEFDVPPTFTSLAGAGNLPACLDADGKVFAGTNTAGVLSCP